MNNSNLEFRKIKSLNFLYEVNENGTIFRNVKSKKQLKIKLDFHHSEKGYYMTMVHSQSINEGKPKRVMIHRIVAECWLGECPFGFEVDHIDRNSCNNDFRNLRYVSKSEQMKNRDHSNISKQGAENLRKIRQLKMKPVKIYSKDEELLFESFASCSRFLSEKYQVPFEAVRYKLKSHRDKIYDYNIIYFRNAETKHDCSTEQEIVHESDLSGNYTTAFNKGKIQETDMRVKHTGLMED